MRRLLQDTLAITAPGPGVEAITNILEAAKIIRAQLDSDEAAGLRFCISAPLTGLDQIDRQNASSTPSLEGLGLTDIDLITSCPHVEGAASASFSQSSRSSQLSWQEDDLSKSSAQESRAFAIPFPRSGIRRTTHQPHSAGLSDDCKYAYFYNDTEIAVFSLGALKSRLSAKPDFPRRFYHQYKDECIFHVALSVRILIIITNRRLIAVEVREATNYSHIDSTSHEAGWDPSGLACYEISGHLIILLGQCRGNQRRGFQGHIKVFKCMINHRTRLNYCFTIPLPDQDWPKILCYEAEKNIVICVTGIQNNVLAWNVDSDLTQSVKIMNFHQNTYSAVSDQT